MSNYFILSCDGGGVRGVLTLKLLDDLMKHVPALQGNVSLFAGTSTGGVISLALAAGNAPCDILTQYESMATSVFTDRYPLLEAVEGLLWTALVMLLVDELSNAETRSALKRLEGREFDALVRELLPEAMQKIRSLREANAESVKAMVKELAASRSTSPPTGTPEVVGIVVVVALLIVAKVYPYFTATYDSSNLRSALASFFVNRDFKNLSDLKQKVLVPTFRATGSDGSAWMPTILTNLPKSLKAITGLHGPDVNDDMSLVDAALATAAAPTYFSMHNVGETDYVDGGVFANDPSMVALACALQQGHALSDIYMLSIGTGHTNSYLSTKTDTDLGMLRWVLAESLLGVKGQYANPLLLNVLMDGPQLLASFQCRQILGDSNFQRVNITLPGPIGLDDASKIGELERYAREYMNGDANWPKVIDWATKIAGHSAR